MQYRTPGFVEDYLTKIWTNLVEKWGRDSAASTFTKSRIWRHQDIYQKNEKNVRGFHTQELSCQIS